MGGSAIGTEILSVFLVHLIFTSQIFRYDYIYQDALKSNLCTTPTERE